MGIRDLLAATPAKKEWPALEPGSYKAHVLDAAYQPNRDNTAKLAMIKIQLDSGSQTGRWINTYVSPKGSEEQFVRNLRPWLAIMDSVGVPDTAIIPADEDVHDTTLALAGAISKALRQGKLIPIQVTVVANAKEPDRPYINVAPVPVEVASVPPTEAQLAAFRAASAASSVADLARAQTSTAAQAGFVAEAKGF